MPSILTDPVPNEVASDFVARKMPVSRAVFDRLLPELKARAICVSGMQDLDAVQRVRDAIAAVPQGGDWNEAKDGILQELTYMVTSTDPDEMAAQISAAEARAELLLRTHGFQAYAAAEYQSLDEQRDVFPYWEYVSARDSRVRDSHAALDGLVIPCDSPFWSTHYPPWDWGCRCQVRPRTAEEAGELPTAGESGKPGDRRVASGDMVRQLEQGSLMEGGRRLDVRPPRDQGKDNPWTWQPGDLRLPLDTIVSRYDKDIAQAFTTFAENTEVHNGVSLFDWLKGSELSAGAAPAGIIPFDSASGFPQLAGFTKTGRAAVARVENEIAALPAEHAVLLSARGEVLSRKVGDIGTVEVPPGSANAFRNGVVSHNHTNGSPPSDTDLFAQFKLGIREVRATTPDGGVFSVVLPEVPNARGRQALQDNVKNAWTRLVAPLMKRKAPFSEIHAAIARLAQENGLRYAYLPREVPHAK
jgi:SPP1 gp7 family putative phage head morphogenesis protein